MVVSKDKSDNNSETNDLGVDEISFVIYFEPFFY